jgi:hypothetical protein
MSVIVEPRSGYIFQRGWWNADAESVWLLVAGQDSAKEGSPESDGGLVEMKHSS